MLDIEYSATSEKHNLFGLVDTDADYKAQYGKSFPTPTRACVYDKSLLGLKAEDADVSNMESELGLAEMEGSSTTLP